MKCHKNRVCLLLYYALYEYKYKEASLKSSAFHMQGWEAVHHFVMQVTAPSSTSHGHFWIQKYSGHMKMPNFGLQPYVIHQLVTSQWLHSLFFIVITCSAATMLQSLCTIPSNISLNKRCCFVFFYAARQRLAVWGPCTLTSGKIWAGSGYISQQVTMPIIAWGPAPTSGMLKTNILRYSAAPCGPHPITWLN